MQKTFRCKGCVGKLSSYGYKIFEECTRYHIWVEYELGPSDNLNSRNLNERLKTLNEFYDRDHEKGRINHNEAEFRAYYILQHVGGKDKVEIPSYVRELSSRKDILNSPIMQEALKLWSAWKRDDSQQFFGIMKKRKCSNMLSSFSVR